ncbi:hypothetical protein GGI15_002477 [Coemansia interrupta]|uniref:Ndc10 domain-containing protein n=1 Tax=Coemansia interrupta TaxID=1126814 RepID=A0A9W8HDG8_9FUNG|nr:hypothetical protein GGI15_002477 [Coemansia interrupta]
MEAAVPEYIFMSGLSAQLARNKRMSSRPASPRSPVQPAQSVRTAYEDDEDSNNSEIKSVVGYLPKFQTWPTQMQFDVPRYVENQIAMEPNTKPSPSPEQGTNETNSLPPPARTTGRATADGLPTGVGYVGEHDRGEPLAMFSKFGAHTTNMTGDSTTLVSSPTDKAWNLISRDTDILLNSILMRRSSYGSMQMRVWHTISVATWLDNKSIMNLTLGAFTADKRSSATMPSYEYIAITPDTSTRSTTASPMPYASQLSGDNGSSSTGGKMRARRTDGADSTKVEIVQHSRPIQCPWNALAMLLYYKWHVLKEPLPDFRTDAWKNTPLFGTMEDSSMYDEYLARFCGDQYEEYVEAVKGQPQRHKRAHRLGFKLFKATIDSTLQVKSNVVAARSVTVGRRIFGSPEILSEIHWANADVCRLTSGQRRINSRLEYPTVGIEASIFPFVDEEATFSNYQGDIFYERDWRESLNAFCRLLKLLRRTLVQDMSLIFEIQFYRRMLRGNSVMSSDLFQSFRFIENARKVVNASWRTEIQSMVQHMPKDTILTRIVPESLITPSRPSTAASSHRLGLRGPSSQPVAKRTHSEVGSDPAPRLSKRKQVRRLLPDTDDDSEVVVESPFNPGDCEIIDLDLIESDVEFQSKMRNSFNAVGANSAETSSSSTPAKTRVMQNVVSEKDEDTEPQTYEFNAPKPVNCTTNEVSPSTPSDQSQLPQAEEEETEEYSEEEISHGIRMDVDDGDPAPRVYIDTGATSVDTSLLLGGGGDNNNQNYSTVDSIPLFAESIGNEDLSNWVNMMIQSMSANNADNISSAEPVADNTDNASTEIQNFSFALLADQMADLNSDNITQLDDRETLAKNLLDRISERLNGIMQNSSIAQSTDPSVSVELLTLKSDIASFRQEFGNYTALHDGHITTLKQVQESSTSIVDDKHNDISDTPKSHRSSATAVDIQGGSTDSPEQ